MIKAYEVKRWNTKKEREKKRGLYWGKCHRSADGVSENKAR